MQNKIYDVAIIGGGPAGSALGCYLAQNNISCIILEREKFPREHVGESLVPSVNHILHELDVMDDIETGGFVKKLGAAWTTNNSVMYNHNFERTGINEQVSILFDERKLEHSKEEYSHHVDRSKFDHLLLKKAQKKGALVEEQTTVKSVSFNHSDYVEVSVRNEGGEKTIKAKMVVDASGRGTVLGRQLKLKQHDPHFNQFAIHAWYKNFDRNEGNLQNYIFNHFLPFDQTWIWQIPITDEITSIGLVTSKRHVADNLKKPEEIFNSFLSKNFELAERINKATRINALKVESDYSYSMTEPTGNRFMLIGDAARYVDPIFSSGVSIALHSAKFASQNIIEAFKNNDFSKEAFRNYKAIMQQGCKNWYQFIYLYYRLNVLFTYFITDPKYRLEVIRFLQGDVYDTEESFLLKDMKATLREVEETPGHIWHNLLQNVHESSLTTT